MPFCANNNTPIQVTCGTVRGARTPVQRDIPYCTPAKNHSVERRSARARVNYTHKGGGGGLSRLCCCSSLATSFTKKKKGARTGARTDAMIHHLPSQEGYESSLERPPRSLPINGSRDDTKPFLLLRIPPAIAAGLDSFLAQYCTHHIFSFEATPIKKSCS